MDAVRFRGQLRAFLGLRKRDKGKRKATPATPIDPPMTPAIASEPAHPAERKPVSKAAIASAVLGGSAIFLILSPLFIELSGPDFFGIPFLPSWLGIGGWIFGLRAKGGFKRNPGAYRSKRLATVGIVLSVVPLFGWLLALPLVLLL